MATVTVSVTTTANSGDAVGVVAYSPPLNQLAPDVTASQRTRHQQQRHARAAAGFVGQDTINTVGTIAAGTWEGDPIDRDYLQIITTVTCASAGGIAAAHTYNNGDGGVGATITFNSAGTQTIDGHRLALGDTVLVVGGTSAQTGIYLVTTAPSASVAGVLTRHPAMNQDFQVPGTWFTVNSGTTYANTTWIASVGLVPGIGHNGLVFTQTIASSSLTTALFTLAAGTGLTGGGSVLYNTSVSIAIDPAWPGQTAITTVGTIATGTWAGTTIAILHGGTGQTTAAAAFNALSPMTTLGDIIYGGTAGAGTRLAGNTTATRNFLRQTGTGTVSAAPAWDTVTKTDVGLSAVENTALSTWAGSTNLTTLGTVTTGTWQAAVASTTEVTGFTGTQTVRYDGTIDQSVGPTTFFSVAALTAIYFPTVNGNALGTKGSVRVRIAGTYLVNSGTPTFTFAVLFGATTLWQGVSAGMTSTAITGAFVIDLVLTNLGATNSQVVTGSLRFGPRAANPTTGIGQASSTAFNIDATIQGTSAEDSTANKVLAVKFLPSANSASVGLTLYAATTELQP